MADSTNGTSFASLFTCYQVLCHTPLTDRDELIREMVRALGPALEHGEVDDVVQAVLEREAQLPSVMAPGIALPHARLRGLSRLVVAVATSGKGVRFSDEDDGLARLIILVLAPHDSPAAYLQAVASLARILKTPGSADTVAELDTAEGVWRFFERGGLVLADYVCAGDIMRDEFISVRSDDTCEKAIDLFARHQLADLPVIDAQGKLVGLVTADALLRVCLPDYILWMEDLSPIINFEPFAEFLRNEGKTWLADIMSDDYVMVDEKAPAIEVAKGMCKRGVRQVLVVRGEELVGVIAIEDFIARVLRE
ncbi:MAG: PTS sugar transporter subunit IIA [Kiritimatiellia bacterium]|jgi:CBS domain-containing protein/mannitol/fructose-specific phosphotransferase system IIA component (Ntr-type)|nr:PTS sugar transporter subunit IIA [Kiritimatiellia bacterium]MDP6810306.1 PTS sugar transporter subunit IIA [Kiritimatiellia bacterium]MDP7022705.1 PTS sugar transporter subunit IIA [Kiritimatiellia bacterium]